MPRILHIDPRVPTSHGVIISRQAVEQHARMFTTIQEARSYARRLVKEAQDKSVALESQAIHAGFQSGWIDSMNAVFRSLADCERLQRKIEESLKLAVQQCLKSALQHPELELHLLEGWLNSVPRIVEDLHVTLPRSAQHNVEAIRQRLQQATGVAPTCTVGDTDSVIIQSGEQIYEFSSETTALELSEMTSRCLQSLQVKKQCDELSSRIVKNWLEDLEFRHSEQLAEGERFESMLDDPFYDDVDEDAWLELKSDADR